MNFLLDKKRGEVHFNLLLVEDDGKEHKLGEVLDWGQKIDFIRYYGPNFEEIEQPIPGPLTLQVYLDHKTGLGPGNLILKVANIAARIRP